MPAGPSGSNANVQDVLQLVKGQVRELLGSIDTCVVPLGMGLVADESDTTATVSSSEDSAFDAGFNVILSSTQDSRIREAAVVDTLRQRRVDGIIVVSSHLDEEHHEHLGEVRIPTVLIAETVSAFRPTSGMGLVTIDEVGETRKLVEHLLELGNEGIGFVGNRRCPRSTRDRLTGYRDAMLAVGITPDPRLISNSAPPKTSRCVSWQQKPSCPAPTALVCYNDMTAIRGLTVLKRRGMRLRQQISVAGFDDSSWPDTSPHRSRR